MMNRNKSRLSPFSTGWFEVAMLVAVILIVLLFFSTGELKAQIAPPQSQSPNCYRSFAFTAAGTTPFISNYGPGSVDGGNTCQVWLLAYSVLGSGGGVTGLTLTVESAPASGGITTPGSWVTFAGSTVSGINPNTNVTGATTILTNEAAAAAFVRVELSGLVGTGTVYGTLQGWALGNGTNGVQPVPSDHYVAQAATTALTIQQPATGARQIVFGSATVSGATVYCAANQTATISWNGTAATATAGTEIMLPNTTRASGATIWTGSNVGAGTTGPSYPVSAGNLLLISLEWFRLALYGTANNLTISTTGTCTITLAYSAT